MPRTVNADLEWALKAFQGTRQKHYAVMYHYYEGKHPIAFATEKFKAAFFDVFKEYAENLCAPVVDALNERLKVVGFRSNQAELKEESVDSTVPGMSAHTRLSVTDAPGSTAWDIWMRNRMDLRSTEVHLESLMMGDGYVLVWPDEKMESTIWPQLANEVRVQYDPNTPGKMLKATKVWQDDVSGVWRLNIYFPDRIDKYQTKKTNLLHLADKSGEFTQIDTVPNPYDRVPMFHFPNQVENKHGKSEITRSVVSVQDGLNKAVIDMLVAMEYAAFKQRYIVGMEVEVDEVTGEPKDQNMKNYGVDRILAIPDPDAKVGQFDATDLTQFIKVQDKFWLSAARVSGTPLHYFYITSGDFPSGEAIKSAEGRFIKRITDRQTSFGNQWEDVMKFAMMIDGGDQADLTLSTMWEAATPRSESELADTAVKKRAIGVPRSQLLREQGYTEEEIARFLTESDAEAVARAQLQMATTPGAQDDGSGAPSRDTTRGRQGVPQ